MNKKLWIFAHESFMNKYSWILHELSWRISWIIHEFPHESSCSWTFRELLIHNMLMNCSWILRISHEQYSWIFMNYSWIFDEYLRQYSWNSHETVHEYLRNIHNLIRHNELRQFLSLILLACIYMICVKFVLKSHRLFPNNLPFIHAPTRWPLASFVQTSPQG